jgi:sec-independent protein translocase protein TatA
VLLVVVLLLVFGAKRLPEIGRSLGSGMREFKDSVSGENKQPALPPAAQPPPQPPVAQAPAAQAPAAQAPAAQAPVAQAPAAASETPTEP